MPRFLPGYSPRRTSGSGNGKNRSQAAGRRVRASGRELGGAGRNRNCFDDLGRPPKVVISGDKNRPTVRFLCDKHARRPFRSGLAGLVRRKRRPAPAHRCRRPPARAGDPHQPATIPEPRSVRMPPPYAYISTAAVTPMIDRPLAITCPIAAAKKRRADVVSTELTNKMRRSGSSLPEFQ